VDTPGHVNFRDEADVACRVSDGLVIVLDAVMGGAECLRRQIEHLVSIERFDASQMVLVVSQMDRLILELRLPPSDAYFKLRYMIDEVNGWIAEITGINRRVFRPELGNVLFASGKFKFVFSLPSFAKSMYIDPVREGGASSFIDLAGFAPPSVAEEADVLAKCLWGDMYCERSSGRFSKNPNEESKRSFIQFVLEPLYKIFSACVSEDKHTLSQVGVSLPASVWESSTETVLVSVMEQMFPSISSFVDAVAEFVPDSQSGSKTKVEKTYTGSLASAAGQAMLACSPEGPLMVHCVKAMHVPENCSDFVVLARVFSGTLRLGSQVKVLAESYSARRGETVAEISQVQQLFVPGGRYWVEVDSVPAGNLVLIAGVSETKACTLMEGENEQEEVEIFKPLQFSNVAAMKIACEPLHPSDLPRMVQSLRRASRAYPQLVVKVEESGEHVLIGTGELYLDCVLHDVRKLYGGDMLLEIRLSDPVVVFNETVQETSQFQCSAASPNKLNAISFIAEPLTPAVIPAHPQDNCYLSREEFYLSSKLKKERINFLSQTCDWDALASRNLWAFGPDWEHGSSVLLNDTLPDQVSKEELRSVREAVVQGFQWATREGPLLEEPVRGCKLKLLDVVLNASEVARGQGQIVPAVCRSVHAAILTACPKLMEPVLMVEMDVPTDAMQAVLTVLSKRRGNVVKDAPKPGTPFTCILAYVPLIDSFGFETDLRLHTKGLGFGVSWFDHWAVVPGDPLDSQVELRPLEPVPKMFLARDFLVKTRRRKGLAEDVVVQKYLDDVVSMGLSRGLGGQEEQVEEY
jgi:U5 small nuclear ribonucleoprotein component